MLLPGLCPHSHPEVWDPYPVISFTEPLPANQLFTLPLASFSFPLPLRAAVFKKGSEPLG